MEWVELREFPGYFVNRDGYVRGRQGDILKPSLNNKGYYFVNFCKDGLPISKTIHRQIAKTFLQNPENFSDVDHIDGNRINNRVDNLQWLPHSKNLEKRKIPINKYGILGLSFDNTRQKWLCQKVVDGKKIQKRFQSKDEATEFLNSL